MPANRSAAEITRQKWGRFDDGNRAEDKMSQTMPDARMKELVAEDSRPSKRDSGTSSTGITGDLGDMGENDSLGG